MLCEEDFNSWREEFETTESGKTVPQVRKKCGVGVRGAYLRIGEELHYSVPVFPIAFTTATVKCILEQYSVLSLVCWFHHYCGSDIPLNQCLYSGQQQFTL